MAFDPTTAVLADSAPSGFDPTTATLADEDASSAPTETAGRVAGLAGRALASGSAALASLPFQAALGVDRLGKAIVDPIRHVVGLGDSGPSAGENPPKTLSSLITDTAPAAPYKPQLSDFVHPDKWQEAANYFADKAGAPTPQTPAERVGSSAVSALPSALLAPEAPIAGLVSSGLGGAASQATAEVGGSPTAQTAAGLLAGLTPAGAGAAARGLIRGGEAGAAATADRIANAAENGVDLTAGQASGSRGLQFVERSSGNLFGGGPIGKVAEQQTEAIGARANDIVEKLNTGGSTLTPTGAGTAINTGVDAAKAGMKAAEKAAYDKVDSLVPADHPVDVSGTRAALDKLATPTPGAEATTGALIPKDITTMQANLATDAANGTMPYSAVAALRSKVGNSIDWGFAPADPVKNGALKQVYGSLTDDLNAGASAVSNDAAQAVTDARSLYAANSAKRDLLNTIVDKAGGPEAVYQAATNGTKQGATKIGGVMSALDPQNANTVRATVLSRLGQARAGAADSTGSFNAATFLTNWNRLAPEAKDALFGSSGTSSSLRGSLDSLTKTISTLRDAGHTLENPSGTGSSLGHTIGLGKILEGLAGAVGTAAHSPHTLVIGGGVIGLNNLMARVLTNPRAAAWLASSAKLPEAALPVAVSQLAKIGEAKNDPDAQYLAAYLRAQGVGRQ